MPTLRLPTFALRVLATIVLANGANANAQAQFDCVAPDGPEPAQPQVLGNGSAGSVSTAQVQAALAQGGAVRLHIGPNVLVVDATLEVTRESSLDLDGATLSGGGARRVINVTNPANAFYRFVLQNGAVVDGNVTDGSGAALYKANGGPWQAVTIRVFNVDFANNHAIESAQDDGGGAVYVVGAAELGVAGSRFDGNSGANGGALYSLGSKQVNLFDSVFTSNRATGSGGNPGNGGNGGAIGVDGDARDVNLCRVRLLGNQANAYGGGLFTTTYSAASFTRLEDSTLQDNVSTATDKLAGGAYIQGSPLLISGSTFRDNRAGGYSGLALFGSGGVLEGSIVNSTFVGNVATSGLGGAMSIQGATALTLENPTIARNSAPCDVCFAAGIANDSGDALTMRNVIFEDNVAGNAYNPWAMLVPAAHGAANLQWPLLRPISNQQETAVAPGTAFAVAGLGDPAGNGGPTETMAIGATSPALDAGTSDQAPAVDQRGLPRDGAVDIGAYERQADAIFSDGFDRGS